MSRKIYIYIYIYIYVIFTAEDKVAGAENFVNLCQVPVADEHTSPRVYIPTTDCLINGAANQRIVTDHDGSDSCEMTPQDVQTFAQLALDRPHSYRVVLTSGRQYSHIIVDRQTLYAATVFIDDLQQWRLRRLLAQYHAHDDVTTAQLITSSNFNEV